MESISGGAGCPFFQISWLWYAIAVVVAFGLGAFWYTILFGKKWLKAVNYECNCGSNLSKGEECKCPSRFPWEMVFQFVSTAIVGLMYFMLTPMSLIMAIFVCIAFSAWTKSMLKFQIANWKRFISLALIDVGYFVIVSIIFIVFAHF
jgi:hypothetical protein